MKEYHFFLGGDDVEMETIKKILIQENLVFEDNNLSWGAKASDYGRKIVVVANKGKIPVLIELEIDCPLPEEAIVIDHHGDRSGEPPSIIQVLNLIGRIPTRQESLIGGMDAGFVFGLQSLGAKLEEMVSLLGLSEEDVMRGLMIASEAEKEEYEILAEAQRAVERRREEGKLIIIKASHSRTGPINTRLIGKQKVQNVLILSSNGEVNYFGEGKNVKKCIKKFPGGWYGGVGLNTHTKEGIDFWSQFGGIPPQNAFWGGYPDHDEILIFAIENFS